MVEKIKNELTKYYDQEDNPLVAEVKELSELYTGNNIELLPDIIVKWEKEPVSSIQYVYSEKYGKIKLSNPGRSQDGRSGNHNSEGFMVINNMNREVVNNTVEIIDIVPTLYQLFKIPQPPPLEGEPFIK